MQSDTLSPHGGSDDLSYDGNHPSFDEAIGPDGKLLPHWQYLLGELRQLGATELGERQLKARRILRDDGATYHIYNTPEGPHREWSLDPVPLLIDAASWAPIEAGLRERAELFNLILQDLYGPRELVRAGVLPPELLFSDRAFLRSCDGLRLPGEHQLILHAVDLSRGPDGQWRALGDRCQAPSGAGYALENRTVMARVFPRLLRNAQAHRLSGFFRTLRNKLNLLAPTGSGSPQVAVFSPGTWNETYFEHAYLAKYLGYPLVQGSDLTVRDGRLWLKSVDGLEPIDVLLRRVDDYYCDPVELKPDSLLGVPGLLEVARSGQVAIVNPLGSGVLENPALQRYLPAIGQHFLGRAATLPNVQTWWCGEPDDLAHVLAHLDQLIIKPTFRSARQPAVFANSLEAPALSDLRERILAEPHRFAAQLAQQHGTTPSLLGGKLLPQSTLLRSFSVAGEHGYETLRGGLTRVAAEGALRISSQSGSLSKDTWVLDSHAAAAPARQRVLEPAITARPTTTGLPSRTVENLFWTGRYAERAESSIRLLRTVFVQFNEGQHLHRLHSLLMAVTHLTNTYPGFLDEDGKHLGNPEAELMDVVLDGSRPGSISADLTCMVNAADGAQELLSVDMQRVFNDIRDELKKLPASLAEGLEGAPEEALDPLITTLMASTGLAQENMVRCTGWRFLNMGRRLERTLRTASLLRSTLVVARDEEEESQLLESVLLSLESVITYRRRHGTRRLTDTLRLVMLDGGNPRALLFQLQALSTHIDKLPGQQSQSELSREQRLLFEATSLLQLADLDRLAAVDREQQRRVALDQLLARLVHLLNELASQIGAHYFDHTAAPQQLVEQGDEEEL